MMRRRRAGARALAAALAAAALLATAATAAAKPPPDLTPGPYDFPGVNVKSDVALTMRDGVRLYADVYRPAQADGSPAPGRFPVVLVQTPYNKQTAGEASAKVNPTLAGLAGVRPFLIRHGYVQVVVDVRGTGSSEGAWDSFGPAEQADSLEIARWSTTQPWADGRLALMGASYMGINQLLTAAQHPPGLKAIFPIIPAQDVYRDVVWHGGNLDAGFMPLWLGIVTAVKVIPPGYLGSDPAQVVRLLAERVSEGLAFPAETTLSAAGGGELAYDGPFYRLRSPGSIVDRIDVPTFIVGGWYDLFVRGEPRLYQSLRLKPGRKQLLMGPWYHVTAGKGLGEPGAPPSIDALALAWFDRWVKGRRNGVERFGPVTLHQIGAGRWARARSWPRKDVRWRRLYLRGERSGSARSLHDASLGFAPPSEPVNLSGEANKLNGLCTRSTVQWTAGLFPPGQPCETDNRLQEASATTFTTEPLEGDLHLSGQIGLRLRGSTTASDTTWIATLADVAPDGRSTQITAGWLVASRRAVDRERSVVTPAGDLAAPFHPFTRESLLAVEPGRPETLEIEIFPTDAVVRRGHRLRLAITSGDVPHLLAPAPVTLDSATAVNTVHVDPDAPSFLTLPLVGPGAR